MSEQKIHEELRAMRFELARQTIMMSWVVLPRDRWPTAWAELDAAARSLVAAAADAQPSPAAIAADPVLAAVFGAAASAPAHQCAQQSTLAQPAVGAAPAASCQATRSGTV